MKFNFKSLCLSSEFLIFISSKFKGLYVLTKKSGCDANTCYLNVFEYGLIDISRALTQRFELLTSLCQRIIMTSRS